MMLSSNKTLLNALALVLSGAAQPEGIALGQVFSWEGDSLPADGGWTVVDRYCDPIVWVADGWYFQQLDDHACPDAPDGAAEVFRNELPEFVGSPTFFVEWRVEGGSDESEIPHGAPTALATNDEDGPWFPFFVASNRVRLALDGPDVFPSTKPGAHAHRLEILRSAQYAYYIDGQPIHQAVPDGYFPGPAARITWLGYSAALPTLNRFDYIRYGVIQPIGSGDFDGDGFVGEHDLPYFHECLCLCGDFSGANSPLNGPPGAPNPGCNCPDVDAGPGCRWADFDDNGTVDCADWAAFKAAWTDPDPPSVDLCPPPPPVLPAASHWAMACLMLAYLSAITLVFARRPDHEPHAVW